MTSKIKSVPIVDTKEINSYKRQIESAQSFSSSLVIKDDIDYQTALSEGVRIKTQVGIITNRKEEITKPMNAALKSIRELFKPLEEAGNEALMDIKKRMLRYTADKEKKQEETKIKLAERVEKGTMKAETAIEKIGEMTEQPKTISTSGGRATTKIVTKYRVADIEKVPMKFHYVDMVAVKTAIKNGEIVDGIEIYQESELSLG